MKNFGLLLILESKIYNKFLYIKLNMKCSKIQLKWHYLD